MLNQALPHHGRPASASRRGLSLFPHALAAIVLGDGFYLQLAGIDPGAASLIQTKSQLANLIYYALALLYGVLLAKRLASRPALIAPLLPLGLLLLWVWLTSLWSVDSYATMQPAAQLSATFVFAAYVAAALDAEDITRLIALSLSVIIFTSMAGSVVFPKYYIHGYVDLFQNIHAGDWRGIYLHKNVFGQASALALCVFFLYGGKIFRSIWVHVAMIGFSALCLLLASSRTAIISSVVVISFSYFYLRVVKRSRSRRAIIQLTVVGLAVLGLIGYFVFEQFTAAQLDVFLSGRYSFWQYLLAEMNGGILIGNGYIAGYIHGIYKEISTVFPFFYHPHSGYFDVVIGLGLVGAALVTVLCAVALSAIWEMVRCGDHRAELLGEISFTILALVSLVALTESVTLRIGPLNMYFLIAVSGVLIHKRVRRANVPRPQHENRWST